MFIDKCSIMMQGLIMAEEHLKAPTDDLGWHKTEVIHHIMDKEVLSAQLEQ